MQQSWEYAATILREAQANVREYNGILAMHQFWEKNKAWMLPYFDPLGRLTTELPGSFTDDDIDQALNEVERIAINKLAPKPKYSTVMMIDMGKTAASFFRTLGTEVSPYLSMSEMVNGKLDEKKPYPNVQGKFMPKGTKVSKYITQLIQCSASSEISSLLNFYGEGNAQLVADFIIDLYAQFVSIVRRDTDYVVLSINPVDMIMASSHTENWRSCHNIFNGEARTGPLSYLCDGVSAIAYAYRRVDYVQGESLDRRSVFDLGFEWPRKLWRQMVFLDKNRLGAWFSREYPAQVASYGRASRGLAAQVLSKYGNIEYKWKVKSWVTGYRSDFDDDPDSGISDAALDSNVYHYKDAPTVAIRMAYGGKYPHVRPGVDRLPCISCGNNRTDARKSTLICKSCDPENRCATCDRSIDRSAERVYQDGRGRYHCESCWLAAYYKCTCCGNWDRRDQGTAVHGGHVVCRNCLTARYVRCGHCGKYYLKKGMTPVSTMEYYCETCVRSYTYKCNACKKLHPLSIEHILTDDGYIFCVECQPTIYQCAGCGAKFVFGYSMIDNLCGKCANEHLAQGTLEIEEMISA